MTNRVKKTTLALASIILASATAAAPSIAAPQIAPGHTSEASSAIAGRSTPISVEAVMKHIRAIDALTAEHGGHRAPGSPGFNAVADYIASFIQESEREVDEQPFSANGSETRNIVTHASKRGLSSRVVVTSIATQQDSPGANDSSTGIAMALEMLASIESLEYNVSFVFLGTDSGDQAGAQHYVNELIPRDRRNGQTYLVLDKLASPNGGVFIDHVEPTGDADPHYDALKEHMEKAKEAEPTHRVRDQKVSPLADVFSTMGSHTYTFTSGGSSLFTQEDEALWPEGTVGEAYDPCVGKACDTVAALNTARLTSFTTASTAFVKSIVDKTQPPGPETYWFYNTLDEDRLPPGGSTEGTLHLGQISHMWRDAQLTVTNTDSLTISLSSDVLKPGSKQQFTVDVSADATPGWHSARIKVAPVDAYDSVTYVDVFVTGDGGPVKPVDPVKPVVPSECSATYDRPSRIVDFYRFSRSLTFDDCAGKGLANATVAVDITHDRVEDVALTLIAPSGSTYPLERTEASPDGAIKETFVVDLSGEDANGTWRLQVADQKFTAWGMLNSWTLNPR